MIELGRHSHACEPIFRGAMSRVIVGNYSSIGEGVIFDCGFQHRKNVTTFPLHKIWGGLPSNVYSKGDIKIGSDCWIGERCIIMSGVEISDGCIIGAGAVVTRFVPPYCIVVGNSHILKIRFNTMQVCNLLNIAWWNWPDERVLKNAHLLLSEDINNFIENYE